MIQIYYQQDDIGSFEARVNSGIAVVAENREDIVEIANLVNDVILQSRSDPIPYKIKPITRMMEKIYVELLQRYIGRDGSSKYHGSISEISELNSIIERLQAEIYRRDPTQIDDSLNHAESLLVSLKSIWEVWDDDIADIIDDNKSDLNFILCLAHPSRQNHPEVRLLFKTPCAGLTVQPGSVSIGLSIGASLTGVYWCGKVVARVAKVFWRTPAAAAEKFIEDMRTKAKVHARHPNLRRLDSLSESEVAALQKTQTIVIFIHGFLSTDIGTFDDVIDIIEQNTPVTLRHQIKELTNNRPRIAETARKIHDHLDSQIDSLSESEKSRLFHEIISDNKTELIKMNRKNIGLVGWPHNTLTNIEKNGSDLFDLIDEYFKDGKPKIIFCCHSRGGLVARETSLRLIESDRSWADKLVDCFTFGTPHNGAALAQNHASYLAIHLMMLKATGNPTSLLDTLVYLDSDSANGTKSLNPIEATDSYAAELRDREISLQKDLKGKRIPPIIAIGGIVSEPILATWRKRVVAAFVGFQLNNPEHDIVVRLRSTVPKRLNISLGLKTTCDHFSYFGKYDPNETSKDHFKIILGRIWSNINLQDAIKRLDEDEPEVGSDWDLDGDDLILLIGGEEIVRND
jgi:hypothetical protein